MLCKVKIYGYTLHCNSQQNMAQQKIHLLHGAIGSNSDWVNAQKVLERKGFISVAHDLYRYSYDRECNLEQFTESFIQDVISAEKKDEKHQNFLHSDLNSIQELINEKEKIVENDLNHMSGISVRNSVKAYCIRFSFKL